MQQEIDPNTFTQKDLMQHLLQVSQHAVTREEMVAQFRQSEQQSKERFEQIDKRFEHVEQQAKERFEQVDKQFEKQHQAIMGIHQEIKNQMRWNFGMLIGVGSLITGILKFTGT